MKVWRGHFYGVYNKHRSRFANAAEFIRRREKFEELEKTISWTEFCKAINKLKSGKSPGINGVPPDALKCLDGRNKRQVYQYIVDFWEGNADYWEWHTGLCVLVPKKGDLSDPNKWRGISFMDVCLKVFSSILNDRLFQLLD